MDIAYTLIFIGLFLMLAEAILPGGLSFSLGLSLSILSTFLLLEKLSVGQVLLYTPILSLGVVILLYPISKKFSGKEERDDYEHLEIPIGDEVKVIETVSADKGKIYYSGSYWQARSQQGVIQKGQTAEILSVDNLVYQVKEVQK